MCGKGGTDRKYYFDSQPARRGQTHKGQCRQLPGRSGVFVFWFQDGSYPFWYQISAPLGPPSELYLSSPGYVNTLLSMTNLVGNLGGSAP